MKYYVGLISKKAANDIDHLVTRETEFNGIVQYLWGTEKELGKFSVNKGIYITEDMVDAASIDTIWEEAAANTAAEAHIAPMSEILGAFFGNDIIVVTNKACYRGAALILNKDKLREVLPSGRYVMIPSSIHECLLVSKDKFDCGLNEFTEMVIQVNKTTVAPSDQLADNAYIIEI